MDVNDRWFDRVYNTTKQSTVVDFVLAVLSQLFYRVVTTVLHVVLRVASDRVARQTQRLSRAGRGRVRLDAVDLGQSSRDAAHLGVELVAQLRHRRPAALAVDHVRQRADDPPPLVVLATSAPARCLEHQFSQSVSIKRRELLEWPIAGIPRRRHRHRHGHILARILADTSDARFPEVIPTWQVQRHADILATILARISARKSVGVGVRVGTVECQLKWQ